MNRLLHSLNIDTSRFTNDFLGHEISGVSTDTRFIKKGDVFFALKGPRFDGADYVGRAFDAGASLSVVNQSSREKLLSWDRVVYVENSERALGSAASDYRELFIGKVIGLTGTSGKTTVKDMISKILGGQFQVHSTQGNFNNQIGLPLTIFGIDDSHNCAVLEMGMSAPGEIAYLASIARPDIGVLLNVGPAHLEFFGSIEKIADAKAELLESLGENGTAVVNGDDTLIESRLSRCKGKIVKFGINRMYDFKGENIVLHPDGCASFDIEEFTIKLNVPGSHNVYNALAAYAVASILGVDKMNIAMQLENITASSMRMERIERDGILFINDSYNANPLSMKAAADVLRNMENVSGGRKIAVLGDMLELGEGSEKAHREIGRLFGSLGINMLCFVGKSADFYAEGAWESGMHPDDVIIYDHVDDAVEFIENVKCPGDIILVKGSRALGMEKVVNRY
ncbi:MAG: UDP-N-acetylmuramoyl-tripeptide--D-alanyl-D-alanine ligase [Candidatus Latescibacteria bacterium]|nr:UDP-N-acetylmuramoyl-tripeptide--D-alanyl-D-alanine ligase [Candidatus Latescibacterota bacterium]